jgi:hypothetical protein
MWSDIWSCSSSELIYYHKEILTTCLQVKFV